MQIYVCLVAVWSECLSRWSGIDLMLMAEAELCSCLLSSACPLPFDTAVDQQHTYARHLTVTGK